MISILCASDQYIINLSPRDLVFWPVYNNINNPNANRYPNKNRPGILLLGRILIIH